MDIFPIWKSTFYESESDSVKFRILKWGVQEICRATAVRLPDDELLRIGLNKPCQNFLDSNIDVSATGTTSSNAYAEFSLQIWNESNSQWFNAYEFAFVNDWSYGEHDAEGSFSEPINGHAAPGQLIPYSVMSTGLTGETICYDEYDFTAYLTVTPSTITFDQTGGTATITIFSNTNWYITQYGNLVSLSQTSGTSGTTTITVTCNENLVIREFYDTLRFRADKQGTTAIEYVHITQEAATPYVRVTSGDNVQIDTGGGIWTITYETNLPNVYYEMTDGTNIVTGYTRGGTLQIEVPAGTLETVFDVYFYDEPGGTMYDHATARKHRYASDHLTMVILTGGTIVYSTGDTMNAQYSLDEGATWKYFTTTLNVNEGDRVMLSHASHPYYNDGNNGRFSGSTAYFNLEGNIMSMEAGAGFQTAYSFENEGAFYRMFAHTNVVSCENLVFPNVTLKSRCYAYMFEGCSSLVTPPYVLPSKSLKSMCYGWMFYGCSSLLSAPKLPATTAEYRCYEYMFYGCSSLVDAPDLPATKLAQECYYDMFSHCTSLQVAPSLPAMELAYRCYWNMFYGCTSLTTPPSILPATELVDNCYESMFQECSSLTYAPELPAYILKTECYREMFRNCTSLQYVKCYATWLNETRCTYLWLSGVNATGTFTKTSYMEEWSTGPSGIPSGWAVIDA